MKLWLDDTRDPQQYIIHPKEWIWITNVEDFKRAFIYNGDKITTISLDHDLGESIYNDVYNNRALTGYDFCKWLVEYVWLKNIQTGLQKIYVHSANIVGAQYMMDLLNKYKPSNVEVIRLYVPMRPFNI